MPLDFNLLGQAPKINTPFENLSQIIQVRNQQEAGRSLAEQRRAQAAQTDEQTAILKQKQADLSAIDAAGMDLSKLPAHLRPVVEKQLREADEWNQKAKTAKVEAEKAELGYAAHLASGVLAWEKDGPEALMNAAQTALQVAKSHGHDVSQLEQIIAQDPTKLKPMLDSIIAQHQGPQAPKPDYTMGDQRFSGATNQPVATAATKAPDAPKLGTFEDYVARYATQRKLKPEQLSAGDLRTAKAQYESAGRAPQVDNEPLVAVMGPDNKPILVRRSQAEGKAPANTREQGRPVTSGDASDIADFDTSKDELAAVRAAIAPTDSTGIVARIGATIPFVTQITGWGSDAKKRQAVIDRVKQVIGKTLEGGVLRKEDEAKYENILPNIGDAPSVAVSKLNGLDAAIDKRKQRRLDALADAGYETSRFTARPGGAAAPPANETPEQRIKRLLGGG